MNKNFRNSSKRLYCLNLLLRIFISMKQIHLAHRFLSWASSHIKVIYIAQNAEFCTVTTIKTKKEQTPNSLNCRDREHK